MGNATIDVRVREVGQLFNSMDPSPFRERELDDNAEAYIVDSVKELGPKSASAIVIHVDQSAILPHAQEFIASAIRIHFARRSKVLRQSLRRMMRRGIISLCIGVVFLVTLFALSRLIQSLLGDGALSSLLTQSLLIAGWVAMWRPLEIFLYDWWPILADARIYERISQIRVRVVNDPKSQS
jgi:hypothetical protein